METDASKNADSAKCYFPQRYVFALMGFLAVANAYAMRQVLNLAITEMVVSRAKGKVHIDHDACPGLQLDNRTNHHYDSNNEFDWTEKTQGEILGSFYVGYVLTHIPGGMLAEHYGGKHVVGIGLLCTAIGTLLTPMAARKGPNWLITVRVIEGLAEGTTFPALNTMLARWAPPLERGKMGSLVFAGSQIGTLVSSTLAGHMLVGSYEWPDVFYLFGVVGVVWFLGWSLLCYNDPASHPLATQHEKTYLKNTIGTLKRTKGLKSIPWKQMALSLPLWALIIGQIGHDWCLFMIQSDLPKYMKGILKFSVDQNGFLSSLPFLIMWLVAIVSGLLSDLLLSRNLLSITAARKLFTTVASIGPAAGLLAASYAGCDRSVVVFLFTVGMAFMGFFYPSLKVNTLDLSPNFAGTVMAVVNGIGAISGIISPVIVGFFIEDGSLDEWRLVFWITSVVVTVSNVVYLLIGSGETQPWNDWTRSKDEEKMKPAQYQ